MEVLPEGILAWGRSQVNRSQGTLVLPVHDDGASDDLFRAAPATDVVRKKAPPEEPWLLVLLDARSGTPIWEVRAADRLVSAAAGPEAVAAIGVNVDGRVVVRRYERKTGRLTAEAVDAAWAGSISEVAVALDKVLVERLGPGGARAILCFGGKPDGTFGRLWSAAPPEGAKTAAPLPGLWPAGDFFLDAFQYSLSVRRLSDGSAVWARSARRRSVFTSSRRRSPAPRGWL